MVFIFVFAFNILCALSQTTCNSPNQCNGQTIDESIVNIYGYNSAQNSSITAYGYLRCYGDRSCIGSELTTTGITSLSSYGAFSTFDSIMTSSYGILGYGAFTIFHSQISLIGSYNNRAMSYYAHSSCRNSTISASGEVRGYGSFSLANSIITSNGDVTIWFYGYRSGESSKVICSNGDNCQVTCVTARDCENLECVGCVVWYLYTTLPVQNGLDYDAFALLTSKENECNE